MDHLRKKVGNALDHVSVNLKWSQVVDCRDMAPWAAGEWLYGPELRDPEIGCERRCHSNVSRKVIALEIVGRRSYGENEDDSDS